MLSKYPLYGQGRTLPFFGWWNRNVDAINAIEDDEDVETRVMKHNTHVARIALLLQTLRYACGESHLQSIDVDSIEGALRLNEYCENCYQRCRAFVAEVPVILCPRSCCICWKTVLTQKQP